jgi:hypothetical protein
MDHTTEVARDSIEQKVTKLMDNASSLSDRSMATRVAQTGSQFLEALQDQHLTPASLQNAFVKFEDVMNGASMHSAHELWDTGKNAPGNENANLLTDIQVLATDNAHAHGLKGGDSPVNALETAREAVMERIAPSTSAVAQAPKP